MAGEPQTDVRIAVTNLVFIQNVTMVIPVLAVPSGSNYQIKLLSVTVATGDDFVAGGTLSLRFGTTDDSNSQAETLLGAATVNPETGGDLGSTDFTTTEIVRDTGVILEAGDLVYAICIADNSAVTFPNAVTAVVEYEVLRRS